MDQYLDDWISATIKEYDAYLRGKKESEDKIFELEEENRALKQALRELYASRSENY